jgi:hypothetical protein
MKPFRPFEEDTLRLLVGPVLGTHVVESIISSSELVSYEYSGAGYFITVKHHVLPLTRTVIDYPIITGKAGDFVGGYLVIIENGELMLECYTVGRDFVPANFRDLQVNVAVT